MKRYRNQRNFIYILAVFLCNANAVAAHLPINLAEISLLYYKDFPAPDVKSNVPVPGCILQTGANESGSMFWHCQEEIHLLRPLSQVALLRQKPYVLRLHSTELNINHVEARIISVHPLKKTPVLSDGNYMQVTGIFITHSLKVRQYKFKNFSTGHISDIRATRDHLFYTENSHSFVPVFRVSSTDHLINDKQEKVQLLCPAGHAMHCGIPVSRSLPMRVYNLEIDKQHTFYAGDEKIFVHNCDISSDVLPFNNHLIDESELAEEGQGYREVGKWLDANNVARLMKSVEGAEGIDSGKVAYYGFHGADSNSRSLPPGVLFMEDSMSMHSGERFIAQRSEEIVDIMRLSPEFENAETVCIINSAPATEQEAESEYFTEYFQKIADLSNKKVVYNRINSLTVYTDRIGSSPRTFIGGFKPIVDLGALFTDVHWPSGPEYSFDSFAYNKFMLVHPRK